ncbi:hypothetical protein PLESTB_000113700 [Pleodorina starrii]|uniref:Uncharacterized protein n=1 Tax=Pleodorina starrii TaxID=330485 RepID=A0A9W6EXM1_9CHLO|nr:hypothetical protein PLESTM_000109400 [Pleodorina starrii]GLC48584.1 hypothetical protein PLESTB_000113700 [Pleodorina starrii]
MSHIRCKTADRLFATRTNLNACRPLWSVFACGPRNTSNVNRWKFPARARPESNDAQVSPSPQDTAAPSPAASPSLLQRALAGSPEWAGFLGTLANSGALTGTLLDGIHSRMRLQVYDTAPIVLGGLKTSLAVPPLLALFYVVLGSLHPLMDNLNPSPETTAVRSRCNDVGFVALAFGVLAALLQLSATLYDNGVPYWQIHLILGSAALLNWRLFDGTRQGILLALLCGLGAPAAELLLLQVVPLWHYPRADLGGAFVSWVFWCYFFYTPALGGLARYLWSTMREAELWQAESGRGAAAAAAAAPAAAAGTTEETGDAPSKGGR